MMQTAVRLPRWLVVLAAGLVAVAVPWVHTHAGRFIRTGAVGGVYVDTQGVLHMAQEDQTQTLLNARAEALKRLPSSLNRPSPLRKISLRRLQEAIRARRAKVQLPVITEEMEYLAGLTRIQFVFVYPEENDIVLAGPAEPITVDQNGFVVGTQTGAPILQLDHLLVALRSAAESARRGEVISCSIDPTPEGLQRLQRFLKSRPLFSPRTVQRIESLLGLQTIRIQGVAPTTDYARRMVAADYAMKRLAMGLDRSGVPGLPSYLQLLRRASSVRGESATPRWWMAPNYEALRKSPDGLAWELQGPGVKVVTEDTVLGAQGPQRTGRTSPVAERWAQLMTTHFEQLATQHPIFGQMRNLMDLTVVGALIVRYGLDQKAGLDLSLLMDNKQLGLEEFPVPRKVPTQAAVIKKGRMWIVIASGGVEMNVWPVVDQAQVHEPMDLVRARAEHQGEHWWWD